MADQVILTAQDDYRELNKFLADHNVKRLFLVCDNAISFLPINEYFNALEEKTGIFVTRFSDFQPNPTYESVVVGVQNFRNSNSDIIIAVGGGSTMDVAKCIKLYTNMDDSINYLQQKVIPNDIPLIAVPTTAGTGSEATRYAVIYYNGEKQSITDDSCIPSVVLMDANALKTLPLYTKKATMMDALCHSIESFWSVNSTDESKGYSRQAIHMILANKEGYLSNEDEGNKKMLEAAHIAGKAINITQTTAGHAMCYKLTSLYGIAHGHAAALCDAALWPFMLEHIEDRCIDPRGPFYLNQVFEDIADAIGCENANSAASYFIDFLDGLSLGRPKAEEDDFPILRTSVNPVRLKNHPIRLDEEIIDMLYHEILL